MAKLNCVTVLAPAKLNLALDVVGLLPGGYHDLDMTMQAITLYERVVLRRSPYLNLRLDPGRQTVVTLIFIREAFGYKEPLFPPAMLDEFMLQKLDAHRTK